MSYKKRDALGRWKRATALLGRIDQRSEKLAREKGLTLYGGHLISGKRDRVYFSNLHGKYPGCRNRVNGSAFRSHIVWWLNTGEIIKNAGWVWSIHHKNEDKTDDRFLNLEKLRHSVHTSLHNEVRKTDTVKQCMNCGDDFTRPRWRAKQRKFCELKCYHAFLRTHSLHSRDLPSFLKQRGVV